MLKKRIMSAIMAFIMIALVAADIVTPVVSAAMGGNSANLASTVSKNVEGNYYGTWADPQNYDVSWFSGGETANTYYISSASQLAGLTVLANGLSNLGKVSFTGKNIKITQSFDMSGYYWIPLYDFGGNIDGGFYDADGRLAYSNVIYGISAKSDSLSSFNSSSSGASDNVAFIGRLSGSVKNLGFADAYFTGLSYVGVVAGQAGAGSVVENCYVIDSVVDSVSNSGVVVGVSDGAVSGCSVTESYLLGGSVNKPGASGASNIGGIVGRSTGSISDCFVTSSSVVGAANGGNNLGGIVGHLDGGSLNGSFTRIDVKAMSENKGFSYVGGVVGLASGKSSVTNSYSLSSVKGVKFTGGFIGGNGVASGSASSALVINCYSLGSTGGVDVWNTGSFAGFNSSGCVIERCYAQGGASVPGSPAAEFIGGNYGALRKCYTRHTGGYYAIWDKQGSENDAAILTDSLFVVGDGGKLRNEGAAMLNSGADGNAWVTAPSINGNNSENHGYPVLTYFAYGGFYGQNIDNLYRKDSDGAYLIETAYQLRMLRHFNQKDNSSAVFRLARNISLAAEVGYNGGWTPFSMNAVFDGNGYSVFNVTVTDSSGSVGFFSVARDVRNLSIPSVKIVSSAENVGGIAGKSLGSIVACFVGGNVSGGKYTGGIVGDANEVFACQNAASVFSVNYAGGIAGSAYKISNSINTGDVSTTSDCVGGIAASVPQSGYGIENSYNLGRVSADGSCAGGIVGVADSKIYACFNVGGVSAKGSDVGGIAGRSSMGAISKTYNLGAVSGIDSVGSILGRDSSDAGSALYGRVNDSYYISSAGGALGIGNHNYEAVGSVQPFVSLASKIMAVGTNTNIVYNGYNLSPELGSSFSSACALEDKSANINVTEGIVTAVSEGDAYLAHEIFVSQSVVTFNGYEESVGKLYFNAKSIFSFKAGNSVAVVEPVFPAATGNLITGDVLKKSDLTGGFGDGVFSWKNPEEIVRASKSYYEVCFYPSDKILTDWSQCIGWNPQLGAVVREVQLVVAPKVVSLIWQGAEDREYNGFGSKISAVADGLIPGDSLNITVVGGEEKNVGTHTATAYVTGASDYSFPESNTVQYVIKPTTVRIWWDGNAMREYDGSPSNISAYCNTFAGDECFVSVENGNSSAAGTYTAVATSLSNPNYMLPADNFTTYTISQKPVTLSWSAQSFVEYTGNPVGIKPVVVGVLAGDSCNALVDGGNRVNVGSGVAEVFGLDNKNYILSGENSSFGYTVTPKAIDVSKITKVYIPEQLLNSGGVKTLSGLRIDSSDIIASDLGKTCVSAKVSFPSIGGPAGMYADASVTDLVIEDQNYTLIGNSAVNNQTYFVGHGSIRGISVATSPKLVYTHGDSLDLSSLLVRADYSDGTSANLSYQDFEASSISLQLSDGSLVSQNSNLSVVDHNGKEIFLIFSADGVGQIKVSLGVLSVQPKAVGLKWVLPENMGYDGTEKVITAQVQDVVEGEACYPIISGNNAKNAGSYVASVTGLSNENYVLQGDSDFEYSIEKRTVSLTWVNDSDLVYDGNGKNVSAIAGNLVDDDVCTVNVVGGNQKNAGEWEASAVELESLQSETLKNYQLPQDSRCSYNISPLTLDVEWSGTDTRQYDKSASNVTASASGFLLDDECSLVVSGGNAVDAGAHTAVASVVGRGASNYSLGVTNNTSYVIEPRFVMSVQLAEALPEQKMLSSATKEYTLAVSAPAFLEGDYSSATVAASFPSINSPGTHQDGVARVIKLTNDNYSCAFAYDVPDVQYTVSVRNIKDIRVLAAPSKLSYTYGETLDLSGLRVMIEYNDGSSENLEAKDLASRGISTTVASGASLSVSDNGRELSLVSGNSYVSAVSLGFINVGRRSVSSVILPDILVGSNTNVSFSDMRIMSPDILIADTVSISGSVIYPSSAKVGTYSDASVNVTSISNDNYYIQPQLSGQRYSVVNEISDSGFKDIASGIGGGSVSNSGGSQAAEIIDGNMASVKSGVVPSGTAVRLSSGRRYTLDGSTPNGGSPLYTSPISITGNTTLKVLADNGVVEVYRYTVRKPEIKFKDNAGSLRFISLYSDNTFRPSQPITRYEVVRSLCNLLDVEKVDGAKSFSDTSDADVLLFANAGILSGFPGGTFSGEQGLTRAEFVKILSVIKGYNFTKGGRSSYPDTSGHWADVYIAFLDSYKYVNGYEDGEFRPNWVLTRAEFSVIMNRAINAPLNKYSPEIADLQDTGYWAYDYIMNSFKR